MDLLCPSVLGWNIVLRFCLIHMALHSVLTKFPVNLGSLLDMMHLGIPYQGKRCWRYSSTTSSLVISLLHSMNLVALEHPWSTMVRMVSYPLDLSRSVIKSMETYWKGPSSVGVMKWCKGAWGSQIVLLSWHLAHPLTYCSMYSLSLGPWYFHLTKSKVLDILGWPPVGVSWMFLRICCHFWGLFRR